jgi:hypothetical protein
MYMTQSFQQRALKIRRIFNVCKYLFPESTRRSQEESLHTADRTEHSASATADVTRGIFECRCKGESPEMTT